MAIHGHISDFLVTIYSLITILRKKNKNTAYIFPPVKCLSLIMSGKENTITDFTQDTNTKKITFMLVALPCTLVASEIPSKTAG